MASLEKRIGGYRVVFRFAGCKFSRSLLTANKTPLSSLARLEDNRQRMELVHFTRPADVDLCEFLTAR